MSLVNATFDWLKKEWAHEVDFVVWTGDNARSVSPYTTTFSSQLTKCIGMISIGTSPEPLTKSSNSTVSWWTRCSIHSPKTLSLCPVLATTIYTLITCLHPVQITLLPSSSSQLNQTSTTSLTADVYRIWKHYIPADFTHVFERGAYFSVEVIPDRLGVISLNTLFWYDSNTRKSSVRLRMTKADKDSRRRLQRSLYRSGGA